MVQEAIIDLGIAFRNYKSPTHKGRYPRFKSKAKSAPSFCAANEAGTFLADGKLHIGGKLRKKGYLKCVFGYLARVCSAV